MDKIELIRKEIERRINILRRTMQSQGDCGQSVEIVAYEHIRDFIDSLPDENTPEPYNPVYDEAYLNEKIAKASKTWEGVDVDKYMDEVRDRELDMYDPQYLDMNYERYYFIPWPDSQLFEEEDPEKEFIVPVEGGVFLSMEWLNKNE